LNPPRPAPPEQSPTPPEPAPRPPILVAAATKIGTTGGTPRWAAHCSGAPATAAPRPRPKTGTRPARAVPDSPEPAPRPPILVAAATKIGGAGVPENQKLLNQRLLQMSQVLGCNFGERERARRADDKACFAQSLTAVAARYRRPV